MLRARTKRAKMGVRVPTHIRCQSHLRWIKTRECLIAGKWSDAGSGSKQHVCSHVMDPHHVHCETDGGIGIKPSDCYTVPLCHAAHEEVHHWGEEAFAKMWRIGDGTAYALKKISEEGWRDSPAGKRWRMNNERPSHTDR